MQLTLRWAIILHVLVVRKMKLSHSVLLRGMKGLECLVLPDTLLVTLVQTGNRAAILENSGMFVT